MRRTPLIELYLFAAFMVAGCAGIGDTSAPTLAAQHAADQIRNVAEFQLCNAITVGAWQRAYAPNPQRATGWRLLCTTATPIAPSAITPTP